MATPSVSYVFLKTLSVQVDIWIQDLTVTNKVVFETYKMDRKVLEEFFYKLYEIYNLKS